MERDAHLRLAGDLMDEDVVALRPEQPLGEAVRQLLEHGGSTAPVVDARGRLVGVLSEKDCLMYLASAAFHAMPEHDVGESMHTDVVRVTASTDMFRLAFLFHEHAFRQVPVCDETDHLIGVVTRASLMRALDAVRAERERTRHDSTHDLIAEHRDALNG